VTERGRHRPGAGAGRAELATQETEEAAIVASFLPQQLDDAAMECAVRLRDRAGPQSLRLAKRGVALAWDSSRASDLNANVAAMLACYFSPEQQAAVAAFRGRSRAGGRRAETGASSSRSLMAARENRRARCLAASKPTPASSRSPTTA